MSTQPNKMIRAARRALAALFLISLLFAFSPRAHASTPESRLRIFDEVWSIIRERYYDPDLRGVDWNALGARLRPLAARSRSTAELYDVLRRMTDSLADAHTRVRAPGENFDWRRPRFVHAGFIAREIGGEGLVVTEVVSRSDAERARVRAGDRIISVNGSRVSDLIRSPEANRNALFPFIARRVSDLFDGETNSILNIEFSDRRGHTRTAQLRCAVYEREIILRSYRTSGVRVVRLDAFTNEIAAGFARAMRDETHDARALVIDLRANGGGETEAMLDALSWFLPAGQLIGNFTDRHNIPAIELRTRAAMLSAADRIVPFRAPVIILTSARTASAAEIFAAALRDAGRARIVGEETCGCVLGARRSHTLLDGGTLDVSELDYRTARGARLEGARVTPDERIAITRADLYARRDPALMRAIEILSD